VRTLHRALRHSHLSKPLDRSWTGSTRLAVMAVGGAVATLSACGASNSGGAPPGPVSTPTSTAAATSVVVGSTSLQRSTLIKGTHAFAPGAGLTQTAQGLTLAVAPNHQTEALNASSQGLSSSLEIGVTVTPPTAPGLLYGVGCEGDFQDFGSQYTGLTDSAGNWQLNAQRGAKVTNLASGTTTLPAGDTQINLACVPLPGNEGTTRLSFALGGKIVGGVDHSDKNIGTGNAFQLMIADPGTGTNGAATFHDLDVRSASAHA
jgi:hypothetical protein